MIIAITVREHFCCPLSSGMFFRDVRISGGGGGGGVKLHYSSRTRAIDVKLVSVSVRIGPYIIL